MVEDVYKYVQAMTGAVDFSAPDVPASALQMVRSNGGEMAVCLECNKWAGTRQISRLRSRKTDLFA